MSARALIVAAPASGSGKTTVTLGLLVALRRRGLSVRAAKAGPDYIDPGFHAAASGAASINLDTWAMPPALLDALVAQAADQAALLVVEGVMGLFDGAAAPSGANGATADIAARFRIPVVLVVDVGGQAQSAAALVHGFATHDAAVRIAGVVLNRVSSERHRSMVTEAIGALGVPVFGALPRDGGIELPGRHLGLVQAGEQRDLAERLDRLGDVVARHVDLDAICGCATAPAYADPTPVCALPPPGQRVALACDAAFTFVYPHLLDGWRRAGAEIVRFSPLADEPPPRDCDCCWLPGGYPELHAGALAAAQRFRRGLAAFAAERPVHGECGGYMVLGQSLEDADGVVHPMAGLLGHATSFAQRKLHLGYREARLLRDGPLGPCGGTVRGHEFHYATCIAAGDDEPVAHLLDAQGRALGPAGGCRGHVSGTFFHAIARREPASWG